MKDWNAARNTPFPHDIVNVTEVQIEPTLPVSNSTMPGVSIRLPIVVEETPQLFENVNDPILAPPDAVQFERLLAVRPRLERQNAVSNEAEWLNPSEMRRNSRGRGRTRTRGGSTSWLRD